MTKMWMYVAVLLVLLLCVACGSEDNNGKLDEDPSTDDDDDTIFPNVDGDAVVGGCTADEQCPQGYYCDVICMPYQCYEERPCPEGFLCQNNHCVSDPNQDGDMEEDGDLDLVELEESEPLEDGDEVEELEEQPPIICDAGDSRCFDDVLMVCSEDGSEWTNPDYCPNGQICVVDQCVPATCTPNDFQRCVNDFQYIACDTQGIGYLTLDCDENQICREQAEGCEDIVCEPNEAMDCLDTTTLRQCNEDGNNFQLISCEENTACVNGECLPVVCELSEWKCEDDILSFCNVTGTGWDELMDCSASGLVCENGTCLSEVCEAGLRTCNQDNTIVLECAGNGTRWDEAETCGDGFQCRDGNCISLCEVAEYDQSYVGCEYWAVDLHNNGRENGGQYGLVVSNPHDVAVTIQIYGSGNALLTSGTVSAGNLGTFTLTNDRRITGPGIFNHAYKLVSSRPVTVTQMNPFGNVLIYSNDASLLIPKAALGDEYRVASWPTHGNQECSGAVWICDENTSYTSGTATVAAVEPGQTTVTVVYSAKSQSGSGVNAESAGTTRTYTLSQYQVLNLESRKECTNSIDCSGFSCDSDHQGRCYGPDLTGTLITADKKLAAFGGHACTFIDYNEWACDHLEHQLYPIQSWGKSFIAVRTEPRGNEADYYRILASEDSTLVSWSGGSSGSVTLNAGGVRQIKTTADFSVTSSKPIMIGHYLAGQDATGLGGLGSDCNSDSDCPSGYVCCANCGWVCAVEAGDPAMMVLAPNEQFRKDYIFLVPPNYRYDHVTLIAPTDTMITLDQTTVYNSNDADWVDVDPTYRRKRITLADGAHTLVATQPVGLYVYGFSAFVSYAYTGGLDLRTINPKP